MLLTDSGMISLMQLSFHVDPMVCLMDVPCKLRGLTF